MKRLTGQRLLRHCFDPKRQQDDGDARLTPARSASKGYERQGTESISHGRQGLVLLVVVIILIYL